MTRRALVFSILIALSLVASGCSFVRSGEEDSSPELSWPNSDTPTTLASAVPDAPTANEEDVAQAPAEATLTSLETVVQEVEINDVFDKGHRITMAVPVGWEQSDFFGLTFEPPDSADLGFFIGLSVDNGCNGTCEAQDWFANLTGPDGPITFTRNNTSADELIRDEAIDDNGWLMVTADGFNDGFEVDFYRWDDGADFYFQCRGETGVPGQQMLNDFLEICITADPDWIG